MTDAQRAARREAYGLVLTSGAVAVNGTRGSKTILQVCHEPELLSLFVEHGANTNVTTQSDKRPLTLMESAILDAVRFEEGSYTAKSLHGLERARFFASLGTNSIQGRLVEKNIR